MENVFASPCFRNFNFYAYSTHYRSDTPSIIWICNSLQVQILCHGVERRGLKSPFVLTKEFIKCDGLIFSQNQLMNSRKASSLFICGLFVLGAFKSNKKNYSKIDINNIMQI